MNTNPDEAKLALWLDDELTGDDLAEVEAWALSQPEQLAAREETRKWRAMLSTALPASEEPPFPDFFNSRILQSIREQAPRPTAPLPAARFSWSSLWMPLAACAGMAFAFLAGKQTSSRPAQVAVVTEAPKLIAAKPAVYTPELGVKAEWFASEEASATVIVLEGVTAFPDSLDFAETAYIPDSRKINSTASNRREIVSLPQ
jgi:hypothetical protein